MPQKQTKHVILWMGTNSQGLTTKSKDWNEGNATTIQQTNVTSNEDILFFKRITSLEYM